VLQRISRKNIFYIFSGATSSRYTFAWLELGERIMRRSMRRGLISLTLIVLGPAALAAPRNAAPPPAPTIDRAALAGSWTGTWTGGSFKYDANVVLDVDAVGNIAGTMTWTLRSTPNANGKSKLGQRAVEYVSGKYYPATEAVVLDGYRREDPFDIWEADKYRLIMSPTHQTMGGITGEHETWSGQLFLRRDE
jgi:hypothetical protein